MTVSVTPSFLSGTVNAPPSKSLMQRIIALAVMNDGQTIIKNPGLSNDDLASLDIVRQAGATVTVDPDQVMISSTGRFYFPEIVLCDESGLAIRMFAPLVATTGKQITLEATGSLQNRDLSDIKNALEVFGVQVELSGRNAPVTISGSYNISENVLDGGAGSQVISGILLAFSQKVVEPTVLKVTNIKSNPYLDLTIHCMERFGRKVERNGNGFIIYPSVSMGNRKITIESDWSNGAFLCVAAAINGNLFISGLNENSMQGDKAILDVLNQCGVEYQFQENGLVVRKCNEIRAFSFDATHHPDLFPPLVGLAINAPGTSRIRGLHRLSNKESNRAETLLEVITKFKGTAKVEGDDLVIEGKAILEGAEIPSHNDHRIAMLAAVLGTMAEGITTITSAEAVNKSWPEFFDALRVIKARIHTSYE